MKGSNTAGKKDYLKAEKPMIGHDRNRPVVMERKNICRAGTLRCTVEETTDLQYWKEKRRRYKIKDLVRSKHCKLKACLMLIMLERKKITK